MFSKIQVILFSLVASSISCDAGNDDRALFESFLRMQSSIQVKEYTEVETFFMLGNSSVRKRGYIRSSKILGIDRFEIRDMTTDSEYQGESISYYINTNTGEVFYRYGSTTVKAPQSEADIYLQQSKASTSYNFDVSDYDVYRLGEETVQNTTCLIFALYATGEGADTWTRIWINPENGFAYRQEVYEGPSLVLTEFLNVKTDEDLPLEVLQDGFEGNNFPVMSLDEILGMKAESSDGKVE